MTIRAFLGASLEIGQDASDFTERIVLAGSIALYRAVMLQILSGSGTGGNLLGVSKAFTAAANNGSSGSLTLTDILTVFYSLDRFWRASKRAFWAMPDSAGKFIAAAVDSQHRPLINIENGAEKLLGKPIITAPELSYANCGVGGSNGGALLFGSGDGIIVRCGRMTMQRVAESSQVDITRGEAGFVFRVRLQSVYYDASASAANPPLVMMAVS